MRRVSVVDDRLRRGLVDLLLDCVDGGASVGFMAPLSPDVADDFWGRMAADVAARRRVLLVADDAIGVLGTIHLTLDLPENQPHRADVSKLLVHRRGRRLGVGAALVSGVEAAAREHGRSLLVLDTVTGSDAERLYARLGWRRAGEIPGYALMPAGGLSATTLFYKEL